MIRDRVQISGTQSSQKGGVISGVGYPCDYKSKVVKQTCLHFPKVDLSFFISLSLGLYFSGPLLTFSLL